MTAARHGILFKGGIHFEKTATLKAMAFDKTGTITGGEGGSGETDVRKEDVLRLAAAAEFRSEHPVAKAVVKAAQEQELDIPAAADFQAIPGQGVQASRGAQKMQIGNKRLLDHRREINLLSTQ